MILQRQVEKDSKLTEGGDGLLLFAQFPPASLIICPFSLYHLACMNKHSVWEPDKISTSFMKRCTGIAKPFKKNNKKKNNFFSFYVFFFQTLVCCYFLCHSTQCTPPKCYIGFLPGINVLLLVCLIMSTYAHTHTHTEMHWQVHIIWAHIQTMARREVSDGETNVAVTR